MDFDIHQLDDLSPESEGADAAFEAFQEALLEQFEQSPEGRERCKADPDMGFWAAQLMYYGWQYEGEVVPQMTVGSVRSVVMALFPEKVSLQSPEQADDVIPELVAFWKYLKREFRLPQAGAILKFLREEEPEFPALMNDPSNFGMAKSFFSMGHDAGFDMSTQEGLDEFMLAYNAGLLAGKSAKPSAMASLFGSFGLGPAAKKAKKKKRKQAAKAKKKNRKRR